jgi:hypothetical protein
LIRAEAGLPYLDPDAFLMDKDLRATFDKGVTAQQLSQPGTYDVILRCEAEGKRFRKQTHFEAIRAMAIADGVWGVRPAPKKKVSCKPQSFDPEAAWQKALEKTYGGG